MTCYVCRAEGAEAGEDGVPRCPAHALVETVICAEHKVEHPADEPCPAEPWKATFGPIRDGTNYKDPRWIYGTPHETGTDPPGTMKEVS